MTDDLYREYILEHYRAPHNKGDLQQPDRFAAYSNPLCGDRLRMGVRIEDDRVVDVRFNGSGCAISQASASMLTDEMLGKSLDELADITRDDIFNMLGIEVGPARQRCALLAWEVLRKGILGQDEDGEDDELE
jgi:nitrogen fixation protein NifU and related proteins